jgi:hypothetical protein
MASAFRNQATGGLRYRPLSQGEIRVLRLKSRGKLDFEFVYMRFADNQSYAALSYTWGAAVFPCHITIGGLRFQITQNLHDALMVIVNDELLVNEKGPFRQTGLLWIDAVCINQQDLDERSTQVRMMKDLYEKAEKIFVWLGKPEDEVANTLAAGKLRELNDRFTDTMRRNRPYRPFWWPIKNRPPNDIDSFLLHAASDKAIYDGPGSPTYHAWLGICALWKKPWWNRTWVYQEATIPESLKAIFIRGVSVIRPNSKVVFLCGSSMFTWSQFHVAYQIAVHLATSQKQCDPILKSAVVPFIPIWNLRLNRGQHHSLTFLELLQVFRRTDCKDPRDKVYAPLGLAAESAINFINPEYKRHIQEVYSDVVQYQLTQKGKEFDFLAYATTLSQTIISPPINLEFSDWPSWIPNWFEAITIAPLPKILYTYKNLDGRAVRLYDKQSTKDHTMYRSNVYNASADLEPVVFVEGKMLHTQGILRDTIAELVDYNGPQDVVREANHRWAFEARGRYPTGEPWTQALRRTNAVDVKYNTQNQTCDRNGSIDFDLLRKPPDQLTSSELEVQVPTRTALNYALLQRKLCRTEQGFLGMVPASSMVGDKICVLCGSQVLHVVRLRTRSFDVAAYAYVGEGYVHGLMDGEVVESVRRGHGTIEHLILI